MNVPYEEKLKKLLAEGKITQEQYQELKANLPQPSSAAASARATRLTVIETTREMYYRAPWRVKVCAILLFVAAGLQLFALSGVTFVVMVLNLVLGLGLLYRQKWAFIVTLLCALGAEVAIVLRLLQMLGRSIDAGLFFPSRPAAPLMIALAFNFVFLLLLCTAYGYFFSNSNQSRIAGLSNSSAAPRIEN